MAHKFVLIVNGELKEFTRLEDIPEEFDHVISFAPDVPPPPHTAEQHEEIDKWNERLQHLMEIERACSNKNRRR